MKKVTEEWFKAAKDDLNVIEKIIDYDYLSNIIAFHSQQVIEKVFKAVIEEFELEFIKTHDLIRLFGIVNKQLNTELDLEMLKKINDIYIDSRYPGEFGLLPYGKPTLENAKEFYKFAIEVYEKIKKFLE